MNGVIPQGPPVADQATLPGEQQRVTDPEREHMDELLDEALRESFPASDPLSTWAGAGVSRILPMAIHAPPAYSSALPTSTAGAGHCSEASSCAGDSRT